MKIMWKPTIDEYIEAIELAQARGKIAGDNIEEEFLEIMDKHNKMPDGVMDCDPDLYVGNLREKGVKVLNMAELNRRAKNEK